ncbi:MAG: hypothetical protein KDJ26_02105 [Alphaproteobacteria bacterium]|jgi:hypothetical protein|nr:hypothetical protein [Alphaproteobacteria bacterium]MCB1550774.1 hypothetical protein [Alphaproteobacteria bacterium]MCB9984385.1 hypothetical protein [Micavibrio sp.]HPQ50187.1 hypothetical protein [Alphaproteobacteria bacterium]HRK97849.1 hypothetical protein [Alphaproteobacteria bacterium]
MSSAQPLMNKEIHSAPVSAADPDRLIANVLEKMERLVVIYTQELDVLSAGDMARFQSLQPDKLKLIRDCELGIGEIAQRKDEIRASTSPLKAHLISTHDLLQDLALQSKRACESRAKSMKRIQDRLLDAARNVVNQSKKGYGRTGKARDITHQRPIATAINEAI